MPSVEAHLEQYSSNKKTLNELLTLDPKPNDWVVTVAFYSALHIIGKTLAEKGINLSGHVTRNKFVETNKLFEDIAREYISLYIESRRARYDCVSINEKKVVKMIEKLKHIEKNKL